MSNSPSINLTGLEKRIDSVASTALRIEQTVAQTNSRLESVSSDLTEVTLELQTLKESFDRFMSQAEKATHLQKVATELVRVRQEIEQEFGSYKVVRETMLGVLQATDLALVKKTTISKVTEELMLATPEYWLAPCLIAVSAWIGNDRDLANRAIAEAVKRDEEKTALTMALICRRNNRIDTCYEWLSIYFARQSASHFTESNFTYLNAYLNGVFGPDEKHMCDDYIAKWMKEIQGTGEDFEKKQQEVWKQYCATFTSGIGEYYPSMESCVAEYQEISDYVSRINSVDRIANTFSQIKNVQVDQQKLKRDIDQTLVTIISRYDAKEEPLRKEEQYLMAVRHFDGNIDAAKAAILEAERKRTEEAIDFVGQMTNVIIKKEDVRPSEQKTALSVLGSYIRTGFESFITEKKDTFPEMVTINLDGWAGVADDQCDVDGLQADYEYYMNKCRRKELDEIQAKNPKVMGYSAIAMAVLGLILLFVIPFAGIVLLAGGAYCFFRSKKMRQGIAADTILANGKYDSKIAAGKQQIVDASDEWRQAQELVRTFENAPTRDIVA